ncbi:MAG: type II toxin-antitoxin system VapB family antitoxin [Bacteroidota bacterium]
MATNLNIDPSLLQEALQIGGLKTKRETVTLALKEFILRRQQKQVFELFGAIEYYPDYDYKKHR